MQAIDTNVLIRIMVKDEKQSHQNHIAQQFAKSAVTLFLPQIVQVEMVWVLESAYELAKNEIIQILQHINENEAFVLQNPEAYAEALHFFQTSNADFSDCLILAESMNAGCNVATFDKKFSQLKNVKLLN